MKVWMPTISTGTGAEVYNRMLAEGLERRGHQVVLAFADHKYQYVPWLSGLKPPIACDVILANSWSAAAFAGSAPLVTIVHHVVHEPALKTHKTPAQSLFHRGFVKPMEMAAIRASKHVVAVSETTRTAIRDHLHHPNAVTVLNGVDTTYFTPGPRPQRLGPLKLLFVGKPSRRKRFDLVTRLVNRLADSASLTVIGPKPEAGLMVPASDFRGRVSRTELREAYRTADFLLLPSQVEGFGYAAAEAMACGTPVLCAPGGAVAEISCIGEAAVALEAGCIADAAEALLMLRNDTPRYNRMRGAARRIAETTLDQTRWLNEMEAVLQRAADI